jgi:glucose-1-phosphate cytidylyltransferase
VKVVILAGGLGTRLAEETDVKPKPMVEIGERPILWHVMKHFRHHGHREFFIALGYRGEVVKRYFLEEHTLSGDMTIDVAASHIEQRPIGREDWIVHLIDTGERTNTGGRVKRLADHIGNETFFATYGDGVSNVDLEGLLRFHRGHGLAATVTAVRPPARFGSLAFDGDLVKEFTEKPQIGEGWINGGFFVLEPTVFRYIDGDDSSLELDALERLARERQLAAFRHEGFWQCMDTLRDKRLLERLWNAEGAPWKVWA